MGSCVAFNCTNRKSKKIPGLTFHSFPKDEIRRKVWVTAVRRENWQPSKLSRLCSNHFPEEMIDRTSLALVRLRENAVPSIFDFSLNLEKGGRGRCSKNKMLKKSISFYERTKEILSAPMEKPGELSENVVRGCSSHVSSSSSLPGSSSEKQQTIKTDVETEFQNKTETTIIIKQEPDETVEEQPRLVIEKVFSAEELSSSSILSSPNSSSSSKSLSTENVLPIVNSDSRIANDRPAMHVSNKQAKKRKILYVEPDAREVKLCRILKASVPSAENSKPTLHPSAGTTKNCSIHPISPTKNGEIAAEEIFQSLLGGFKNNPTCSYETSEKHGDLFDVFAALIAKKLREMDWNDCAYALKAILGIVSNAGKVKLECEVKS